MQTNNEETLNLRSQKLLRIEYLNMPRLLELNLSHNQITKMENLSHLTNLRELNLSDNKITTISDIDQLPNLCTLNLNGNQISIINVQCQSLQILKLSRNLIKDTTQLLNLKLLPNLQQISLSDNPFCRTFTYTEFILFLAPTLEVVDSKVISREQARQAQILYGAPPPCDLQQIQQNIHLIEENRDQIEKEIQLLEGKIHRATNLLETYYEDSDSDEDNLEQKQITQNTLQHLHQQFELELQRRAEAEEILAQLQQQLQTLKIEPKPKNYTDNLNKLNTIFVRLQAILQCELVDIQKTLFNGVINDNLEVVLVQVFALLQMIVDRIPYLPQESMLSQIAEQVHKEIETLYNSVSDKPNKNSSENPIQRSIALLKKLFRRAERKYEKIETFNKMRTQFLTDFEAETANLASKWKEFEARKQEFKREKAQIAAELEEQINEVKNQKADLKQQHAEIDNFFAQSNQDFEYYRVTQEKLRQELYDEIQALTDEKSHLNSSVMQLRLEHDQIREKSAETEESVRLLTEEIEMLQQRIQEQYQLSFEIKDEQQHLLQQIEHLTTQKNQALHEIAQFQQDLQQQQNQLNDGHQRYMKEQARSHKLSEELETVHSKLKQTEQLCKEADKVLRQLNLAITDKEDDLNKYDKVLAEAKDEKEKLRSLKQDIVNYKKELQKIKSELESHQFQYQQNQDNLQQAKKNLQQITQLTNEKEQDLLNTEKQQLQLEKSIQEAHRLHDGSIQEIDNLQKEIKALKLEKAKLTQTVDDQTINLQSLKQEFQIQNQNLVSLQKQIEAKVTELSTTTHYHKQELQNGQEQLQLLHEELMRVQEQQEIKGYEFKSLVDQIDGLMQKRDLLVKDVYGMQQSLINKPYIVHDEEQNNSYDKFSLSLKEDVRQSHNRSQQSDYPRVYKPRSGNQSMGLKKSGQKDQSVQSVMQNLEELNNNLDRMYMESRGEFYY